MQQDSDRAQACPRLPEPFSHIGRTLPLAPTFRPAAMLLQSVFAGAIEGGKLDHLENREFAITVDDLGLRVGFTQVNGKLEMTAGRNADASIRGPLAAFLWLAAKRADADTLFFHRHLMMEGDTELGLVIKNLLDATEMNALPGPLSGLLEWLADRVPGQPPGTGFMPG